MSLSPDARTSSATIYLLEFVDADGAASQQQAFASLDGAKASLDADVQWKDCSDADGAYWEGIVPDTLFSSWWITELKVHP